MNARTIRRASRIVRVVATVVAASTSIALAARHEPLAAETILVEGRRAQNLTYSAAPWTGVKSYITGPVGMNGVYSTLEIGGGDFIVKARIAIAQIDTKWTEFAMGDGHFFFDGQDKHFVTEGGIFGPRKIHGDASRVLKPGKPFEFEVKRSGKWTTFSIEGDKVLELDLGTTAVGRVGFVPQNAAISIYRWTIDGRLTTATPVKKKEELAPLGELQPAIENAIQRGVDFLFREQLRDGSWAEHQNDYFSGETALCVYTLLHCGLKPDHPSIVRALRFLEPIEPKETYVQGLTLMAFDATGDKKWLPKIKQLAQKLCASQNIGLWSYRGGRDAAGDISNTQYAALGLRAAAHSGVEIAPKVWSDLADAVLGLQETPRAADAVLADQKTGTTSRLIAGFRYNGDQLPTGSRTAAGISLLAISRDQLGWKGGAGGVPAQNIARAIQLGVGWLDVNFAADKNPLGEATWVYYYLYGLERVGSLLELDTIGEHEWYRAGAQYLVRVQDSAGPWKNGGGDQNSTCYALLFLRRATRNAPSTGGEVWAKKLADTKLDLPVRVAADGATPCTIWFASMSDAVRAAYSNAELGGPRVKSVEYTVDDAVVAKVDGKPREAWKGDKFAARVKLEISGTYKISARVSFVSPNAPLDADEPVDVVESEPIQVRCDGSLEPWMSAAVDEPRKNQLIGAKATFTPSSVNGGDDPKFAIDGLESTRWMCKNDDAHPTLVIALEKPIKASQLVLYTHCVNAALRGQHDRIRKVGVRINRQKDPTEIAADVDELHPIVLAFPALTNVDRIEIQILEREPGRSWPGFAGFAEVSLEK